MDPKIHNKGEVGEFEELKGIKTHWNSGWRERKSGDEAGEEAGLRW